MPFQLDPTIPLAGQQQQRGGFDMLGTLGALAKVRYAREDQKQQVETRRLQIQKARQAEADADQLRQAINAGGDEETILGRLSPHLKAGAQSMFRKQREDTLAYEEKVEKAHEAKAGRLGDLAYTVDTAGNTPEAMQASLAQLAQEHPEDATWLQQQWGGAANPAVIGSLTQRLIAMHDATAKRLEARKAGTTAADNAAATKKNAERLAADAEARRPELDAQAREAVRREVVPLLAAAPSYEDYVQVYGTIPVAHRTGIPTPEQVLKDPKGSKMRLDKIGVTPAQLNTDERAAATLSALERYRGSVDADRDADRKIREAAARVRAAGGGVNETTRRAAETGMKISLEKLEAERRERATTAKDPKGLGEMKDTELEQRKLVILNAYRSLRGMPLYTELPAPWKSKSGNPEVTTADVAAAQQAQQIAAQNEATAAALEQGAPVPPGAPSVAPRPPVVTPQPTPQPAVSLPQMEADIKALGAQIEAASGAERTKLVADFKKLTQQYIAAGGKR